MSPNSVLVAGATGKQGGGVVKALLAANAASGAAAWTVLAVTRSASSSKAKALAESPYVSLIEGNADDAEDLLRKAEEKSEGGKVYGVFSVQPTGMSNKGLEEEVKQGMTLADAAAKHGVQHFVYSSVEMGSLAKTEVPHFETKRRIEEHIKSAHPSLPLTVLRPTAFMDNFEDLRSFTGRMFVSVFRAGMEPNKKVQMIACSDIGLAARAAFENPEQYVGKDIPLAGDELTVEEIQRQFKEVRGYEMPRTYGSVGSLALWSLTELKQMFKFFNDPGYQVNIAETRKQFPEMKTWKKYLETEFIQ